MGLPLYMPVFATLVLMARCIVAVDGMVSLCLEYMMRYKYISYVAYEISYVIIMI